MYEFKNALAAIKRNLGKNIFLSLLMLVVIAISCIALIINNTANDIASIQKEKYGSKVFIQPSEEMLKKQFSETTTGGSSSAVSLSFKPIENDILLKIAQSTYVKGTDIQAILSANSDTLKPSEAQSSGGMSFSTSIGAGGETVEAPDFFIRGYNDLKQEEGIQSGKRIMQAGELPKAENECMISAAVAKENQLSVGDTIEIQGYQYDTTKPESNVMKLTISGIYVMNNSDGFAMMNSDNDIYMLYNMLVDEVYQNDVSLNTTYYLNSPNDIDAFSEEVYGLGVSEDYEVTTDEMSYNQAIGPIESLSQTALVFLWVVLLLGACVLVLLTILGIRDRNYEIGILRSLGMKKRNVMVQMLMEPFILICMTLVIGCGIGSIMAQPIASSLLEQQIESAKNPQTSSGGSFLISTGSVSGVDMIESINVQLDVKTTVQLCGIAMLLILISGMISCVYITKYEPMQILSERR